MSDSSLIIRIGADASGVKKGVDAAKVELKDLGESAISVAHDFVELAEKAIEAGKALTEFLVGASLEAIDSQAKLARNIGSSIDGLRSLQLYAKDAGISEETLATATAKFNQTIGQGLNGNEKANEALRALTLNARELQGMDADEKMATLADAIRACGLSTEQTVAALKELGIKGGTELVDSMRNGGEAIRAARKEVDEFGISLSDVDARKVEAANDAMDRMHLALEAVQNRIAIALSPILTALADKFNGVAKSTDGFKTVAESAVDSLITGFKIVADATHVINIAWEGIHLALAIAASAVMDVINAAVQLGATLYDVVATPLNLIIKGFNALGGHIPEIASAMGSEFAQGMNAATDAVEQNVTDVYNKLVATVTAPLPHTAIDEFIAHAQAAAQAQAEAAHNAQPGNNIDNAMAEQLEQTAEAHKLQFDEQELFNGQLLAQQAGFEDALMQIKGRGAQQAQALSTQIKMQNISDVTSMASQVLGAYSTHSKKMFDANKALNIGIAIMNTFKGVSESLAMYPMPLAAVMAALHLALGLANVNNIKSQQFGSATASGGGAGGDGGAAAAAAAAPAAPARDSTLMVQGIDPDALFSGSMVRSLAGAINQHVADGGKLVIM